MTDFTTITTIAKNFDIEKTLTENQSIREDNNALASIGISAAFIILGIAIYLANEEYKDRQKYLFIVS